MTRLKTEEGFTLAELLIVAAILGLVMAAIVGIYQMTQRSILFASAGEDAQVAARAVLDRLATDLRLINAGRSTTAGAITAASATSMTFRADIDNDTLDGAGNEPTLSALVNTGATTVQLTSTGGFSAGELLTVADGPISETQSIIAVSGNSVTLAAGLSTWYPAGSVARSVETVTYTYTPTPTGGTLTQTAGGGPPQILADNLQALQFTYWDGSTPPAPITDLTTQGNRDQIREIRVQSTTRSQSGDQTVSRTMSVSVRPRNLF